MTNLFHTFAAESMPCLYHQLNDFIIDSLVENKDLYSIYMEVIIIKKKKYFCYQIIFHQQKNQLDFFFFFSKSHILPVKYLIKILD